MFVTGDEMWQTAACFHALACVDRMSARVIGRGSLRVHAPVVRFARRRSPEESAALVVIPRSKYSIIQMNYHPFTSTPS